MHHFYKYYTKLHHKMITLTKKSSKEQQAAFEIFSLSANQQDFLTTIPTKSTSIIPMTHVAPVVTWRGFFHPRGYLLTTSSIIVPNSRSSTGPINSVATAKSLNGSTATKGHKFQPPGRLRFFLGHICTLKETCILMALEIFHKLPSSLEFALLLGFAS